MTYRNTVLEAIDTVTFWDLPVDAVEPAIQAHVHRMSAPYFD